MASCLMVARCVGVRTYMKKDNTPGFILSVAMDDGQTLAMPGNGACPSFPFGTFVSVGFDLNIFNGKVNGLRVQDVKEYDTK